MRTSTIANKWNCPWAALSPIVLCPGSAEQWHRARRNVVALAPGPRRCGSRRGVASPRFARNLFPSQCSSPIAVAGSFRSDDGYCNDMSAAAVLERIANLTLGVVLRPNARVGEGVARNSSSMQLQLRSPIIEVRIPYVAWVNSFFRAGR